MRRVVSCVLVAFVVLPLWDRATAQDAGFVRHSLLDGRLTVQLPASLQPMSNEMRRIKYPGSNRPAVAFSDATGSVSFALSWTAHRVEPHDVPLHTARLRSQMEKESRILRWHATDVLTIDGREVGLLDFDSQAIDSEIRNKMLLAELGGRLLLLTFNMTKRREAEWAPIADRVMGTLRFR